VKPGVPILLGLLFLSPAAARAVEGYRVYESTAATVNGEVIFVSDVAREECFLRCAAMPGTEEEILSLRGARDRLILDMLALQEQRKLLLGAVDNAVLEGHVREAESRMAACPSPCKGEIAPGETREWIRRKLLLRDFFNRRVAVFVEVKDEDVERELERRSPSPGGGPVPTLEEVRDEMLDERIAKEIRNWQTRAASKSRLILSPMEDR
jgi:phosphoserine phosphatase